MTSETSTVTPVGLRGLPFAAENLSTERLLLRPLTSADVDNLHVAFQKKQDVVRYLRWEAHDHDEPIENLAKRIAMSRLEKAGDGLIYSIELPEADGGHGRRIGDVSVLVKSAKHEQIELGWVFHPAVHGRGFATEAVTAILDQCFNTLGAHRVFAEVDTTNEASARLCGILGMEQEALLHERECVDGEWRDMAIFAIRAEDFAKRQA